MQMFLLGKRQLDFVSADGNPIQGTQLFVSYPAEKVEGEQTDRIFIKSSIQLPPELTPGDILDISFNNKGKPEAVKLIQHAK